MSAQYKRARVLKSLTLRIAERDIQRWYSAHYFRDNPPRSRAPEISWRHVYQLIDPRDGKPFYVGKGGPYRLPQHERDADMGLMTAKAVRIREIWGAGLQVEFRTVGLFVLPGGDSRAYQFESQLIKEGGDQLTNNQPPVLWRDSIGFKR